MLAASNFLNRQRGRTAVNLRSGAIEWGPQEAARVALKCLFEIYCIKQPHCCNQQLMVVWYVSYRR